MNEKQFHSELEYSAAVSIATSMLRRHLITPSEFEKIKSALIDKHRPVVSSLHEAASCSPPRKR
jgi:hypothetical protein